SMIFLLSQAFNGFSAYALIMFFMSSLSCFYLVSDAARLHFSPGGGSPAPSVDRLCFLAGFAGGMFMFGRPLLNRHLNEKYHDQQTVSATMTSLLFFDAAFRCLMLVIVGLITVNVIIFTLFMLPFILVGAYAGKTRVDMDLPYMRMLIMTVMGVCGLILFFWNLLPSLWFLFPWI
ncbi:hypothetical protein ACFLRF_04410, partial [Candidatus Altiarchaeota archaeon]